MKPHAPVLLIILALVGCGKRSGESIEISQDEYDVLSVVLDSIYTRYADGSQPRLFIIEGYSALPPLEESFLQAEWPEDLRPHKSDMSTIHTANATIFRLQSDLPDMEWNDLRTTFDSVSKVLVPWDSARIHISHRLYLGHGPGIGADTLTRRSGHFPPYFLDSSGRTARVSRVAFNRTHDQALVYYYEGGDGYTSLYLALKRVGSRWVILRGRGSYGI